MSFGLSFYLCISDREVEIRSARVSRIGIMAKDFTTVDTSPRSKHIFQDSVNSVSSVVEMYIITSERGNMKCRKCNQPAVINMRQHKMALCAAHFLAWLTEQTQRFIEKYQMFTPRDKILVAVSGGKD